MQSKASQCDIFSDDADAFRSPVSQKKPDNLIEYKFYGPEMVNFINKFQEKVEGIITDDQIQELCKSVWYQCKGNERDYNMAMLIIHKNNPLRTITTMDLPNKGIVSLLVSKHENRPSLLWHRITFERC